jgi:hypothetical protein
MAVAGLTFGQALEALSDGSKVWRSSWKGAYLLLVRDEQYELDPSLHPTVTSRGPFNKVRETPVDRAPWIGVKTEDQYFQPWAPNHIDLLSKDWEKAATL